MPPILREVPGSTSKKPSTGTLQWVEMHFERGAYTVELVRTYLYDLLARTGWRSTDMRMTIMVAAMWNDVNDGAKKGAQYPQALKERKDKYDYFFK